MRLVKLKLRRPGLATHRSTCLKRLKNGIHPACKQVRLNKPLKVFHLDALQAAWPFVLVGNGCSHPAVGTNIGSLHGDDLGSHSRHAVSGLSGLAEPLASQPGPPPPTVSLDDFLMSGPAAESSDEEGLWPAHLGFDEG